MKGTQIRHFIFDLGGVIINLDTSLTIRAFAQLMNTSADEILTFTQKEAIFIQYEKGEVSNNEFRNTIKNWSQVPLTNEQIDNAWNAMILDLPIKRIELLRQLNKAYDIYLLSNTNTIHMECVNRVRAEANVEPFDELFNKDFYSHIIGKRKPDAECFQQVIDENNLDPKATLFLDDNAANISGASALGLQTLHVTSPTVMMDYFANGRTN